ncbi:MAG TPA: aromatic amino acid lyase [Thermoanaerobaculia bacterium]
MILRTLRHDLDATTVLALDGRTLTLEDVVAVARRGRPVAVDADARRRVGRCRAMVEVLLDENEKVYGLTTGFGKLRDVAIPREDTAKLQVNLIMSHSCGVGRPFTEEVVRAALVLRANTLCRGNSGVRVEVVEQLVNMLNDGVYPYVPEKGSVGASGDLAPLSHLALVLIGHPEGRYMSRRQRQDGADPLHPREQDFVGMPGRHELAAVAEREGWKTFRPVDLEAKEGLAVNNGTQLMTAVACLALFDGYHALRCAELAGALSLEAQRGVLDAYDPRLHAARPQAGQGEVAARVVAYCEGSQILDLYLNSGNLYQAQDQLRRAAAYLAGVPGAEAGSAREGAQALATDLGDVIPTQAQGRPDAAVLAEWSGLGARGQIAHFYGVLRPLRRRASDLLRVVDADSFPHHTENAGKARTALVAAVKQLDDAVPETPLVQEDYSFRCFPQVLACALRAWEHVAQIVEVEVNSATDNPLLFPPDPGDDAMTPERYGAWLRADRGRIEESKQSVLGGGNFHGEPVAQAMDYFAIAFAEVANIAERRVAHLVDEHLSRGLPPFLIDSSGLNSGFMIPQYTAAALVSENKVLCHPASVDSIPTSANSEDHVSMGTIAARKAAEVLANVVDVIAIEVLAAYQGLKFRLPLEPGERLRGVLELLAEHGIHRYEDDRVPYRDFQKLRRLMREKAFLDQLL